MKYLDEMSAIRRIQDRQCEISWLLTKAEEDISANRLTLPEGNNALEKYREVLYLDSGNVQARHGLIRLAALYRCTCYLQQISKCQSNKRSALAG